MPGVASLQAQQYYAHPRNAFWPILAELLSVNWAEQYSQRILQLKAYPLVLWDVLQSCQREGSLDSAITRDLMVPNDIPALLKQFSDISFIGFNGASADRFFNQSVARNIDNLDCYKLVRLPSTSPAHASQSLQQKLEKWSVLKPYLN